MVGDIKKFQALKCSVGYGLQAHERDFAEKLSIKSAEPLKNFPRFASAHCNQYRYYISCQNKNQILA